MKLPSGNIQRQTLLLGTATYTTLLVLAAVFYLERMAMLDMAFQCLHILRVGEVQIQSGRFGAAATQFFPWAAQALGLPLKGVLLTYSLGHVLYYFLIFLLITQVLGQWKWGIVLILLSTLITTHTFYWLSEMPQGLAFLLLILAWMDYKNQLVALHWWEYPLLAFALVTAFYFHPMVLYAMLFCSVFVLLNGTSSRGKSALYFLAITIFLATVVVKYKILKLDWYDAMSLERSKTFGELWPHWLDIQSNRDFIKWCATDYYLFPILYALGLVFYFIKKNWLKAALLLLTPLAYILLVNVPFHTGDRQFYLENLYLPLAIFVAVPLVFDVLPAWLPENKIWIPVALLAGLGLLRIYQAHQPWSDRLHWEQQFLEKTAHLPNRKLLLTEEQVPMDTLLLSWGTAYEFLMLSALEHPDSARCILVDEASWRFDTLLAQPRLFLGEFKNYRFDELPRRYFNFQDSSAYVRFSK